VTPRDIARILRKHRRRWFSSMCRECGLSWKCDARIIAEHTKRAEAHRAIRPIT